MTWLVTGVVYSVLYVAAGWMLQGAADMLLWFRTAALLLPPMTGVIVIARRRHVWTGNHWLFWATLALGLLMSGIGLIGWAVDELLLGRATSWLGWYTVFSLFGGIAPLYALLTQAHRGSRENATGSTAVDIAGLAVMTGFLYSHFMIGPDLMPATANRSLPALMLLSEFQQVVSCVGMGVAAVVARRTLWAATYRRLTIGLVVNLVIQGITNTEISMGLYRSGFVYDVAWILPFAFYPWAAANAPTSNEVDRETDEPGPAPARPWVIFGALTIIPLADYGLRWAHPVAALDEFRDLSLVITIFSVLPLLMARLAVERGEARQADSTRRLLATATEQADELIAIMRPGGQLEHVNGAFKCAHGYSPAEIADLVYTDVLAEQVEGEVDSITATVLADGVWRGCLVHRRKNGSTFASSCVLTSLTEDTGAVSHFVAVERDVTEDNRLHDQLVRAKDAAEAASRVKGEFLANMSHEIRTPMNGVLGMTELVLDTALTSYQADCLNTVKSSAASLLTILNEILDFSKIDSHRLELESASFSLRDVVAGSLKPLVVTAAERGLELVVDIAADVPADVTGDAVRLQQVLVNLVGNAIKFTDRGRVLVTARLTDRVEGRAIIRFAVADTGVGIPSDKHASIFEPFSQADGSTTRRYGGTGLGLTISQKLVRLMGGQILLESTPGLGSTFAFTVPFELHAARGIADPGPLPAASALVDDDGPAHRPMLAVRPDAAVATVAGWATLSSGVLARRQRKVLLAEDNLVNQRVAAGLLHKRGHQVTVVDNGFDAVRAVERDAYDIVLMDVQMPGMGGVEATAAIRAGEEVTGGHVRIVATTAHAMNGDRERCLRAGMDAYLSKPIDPDRLFEAVEADNALERPRESAVDGAEMRNRLGGDEQLMRDVVRMFLEDCPVRVAAIKAALDAGSSERLRIEAHALKGAAGNLSATQLFAAAERLEQLGHENRLDRADAAWKRLVQETDRAVDQLRRFEAPRGAQWAS